MSAIEGEDHAIINQTAYTRANRQTANKQTRRYRANNAVAVWERETAAISADLATLRKQKQKTKQKKQERK